jgi:hypothetical protein
MRRRGRRRRKEMSFGLPMKSNSPMKTPQIVLSLLHNQPIQNKVVDIVTR